jgi:hypothetical protein
MLALAALFALAPALAAEPAPALTKLIPGRYEVRVEGLLCHQCTRQMVKHALALREVEAASADFDRALLLITVKGSHVLRLSRLQAAMNRAAADVDLHTRFRVVDVRYHVGN